MSLQSYRPLITTTITASSDKMTQVATWRQKVASCSDGTGSTSPASHPPDHDHDDGATVSVHTYYDAISDFYEEKEGRMIAEERLAEVTRQLALAKRKLADERLRLKMERKRGDNHFRKTILLEAVARSLTEENTELKKEAEERDKSGGTCCMFSFGGDHAEGACSPCCECCVFETCRIPCSENCPVPSVLGDDSDGDDGRDEEEGGCDGGERSQGTFGDGGDNGDDGNDDKERTGNGDGNGVVDDKQHSAIISGSDHPPDEDLAPNTKFKARTQSTV